MSRRRDESILDDLLATLKIAPSWVGPVLAAIVFTGVRLLIPSLFTAEKGQIDAFAIVRNLCPMVSWCAGGLVLFVWIFAEFHKLGNRRLIDDRSTDVAGMTWREFERLVCEAYRRQGYFAEVVGSAAGDGGVDVKLTRGSEIALVQCKHWRSTQVGVSVIRELLGVVASEGATKGIVVTSGVCSKDAKDFAARNPQIELIDGKALSGLIEGIRRGHGSNVDQKQFQSRSVPLPNCPSAAVLW